jgi:hypothetical protein
MSGLKGIKVGTPTASRLPERSRELVASEPLKRLTIDLPESMHAELKAQAAMRRTTIREIILSACTEILKQGSEQASRGDRK